jgi:hypothetical protein
MHTSSILNQYMDGAAAAIRQITQAARQSCAGGKPMLQDYPFWLYNAVFADYSAVTFLTKCISAVEYFDVRPLYCIVRSTLEKYADLANLHAKGRVYENYLWYLNFESNSLESFAAGNDEKGREFRRQAESYKRICMETFGLSRCNRLTRYYLMRDFNGLLSWEERSFIVPFNKKLSYIDSKCSQLLHNNVTFAARVSQEEIQEILLYMHYVMWTVQQLLPMFYTWPLPEIQEGSVQLRRAIECIHAGRALTE